VLSKSVATFRHTVNKLHFSITGIIEFYVDVHRVSCCKLHVVFNILLTFFLSLRLASTPVCNRCFHLSLFVYHLLFSYFVLVNKFDLI